MKGTTMSNDAFGNLGDEMRAMKDGRATLRAGIKDNHRRVRAETGQTLAAAERFIAEAGKANQKLSAQTRQRLAQAQRELKAGTRQTLTQAEELVGTIRRDVAALKADAGRILADATGFLAQTGSDNAKLKAQTRTMLAHARAESQARTRATLAQAGQARAQTQAAVAGLKMQAGQVLADAMGVMKQLSESSRQRAAGWQNILHVLHGRGSRPIPGAIRTAPAPRQARKTVAKRTRTGGKTHKRRAA
jgi:hypothetical protein